MTRLLVSVRDADEALAAAGAGADFIDLKDPAAGALGGLAPARIAKIVPVLRARCPEIPISATVGDLDAHERETILRRVADVAACGVDYVKVGVSPCAAAAPLLSALARCGAPVVPVLLADLGVDAALVEAALRQRAFPALMLDTSDKRGGSLLQRVPVEVLARFVALVQGWNCLAGLAGALRADDAAALRKLAPDFAGFRSAVCEGGRAGPLDPQRVRGLRLRLAMFTVGSRPRPAHTQSEDRARA
ncbi:(5-formylfuran-3-yl)methyl phosphate synthase [Piscinibacter sp. XHJ-5]|uniref:(5-formylfuran-3-yl)methyl phosphate synthase n=1 Tax=Piscinibacter sp. XHJ-5 TaxID=3037797 RepID=UPI002452BC43|nr:(5-formylfuran-3-yl)methyl phosphate synthase [Piscinibacter sp. XHJ-5]